ncbi:NEDD4-binding protein 1 [Cololabis saira]|uniref:NEDD4-binding protein 1 n=1 Tax=Cololabis saira TaxID=129043 RepID=UPI002AD1EF66|nr:NEDD4-binding protein 1 [Cololabis saira]
MDIERSKGAGGGGGDYDVEDEFACAEILRVSLASLHSTVERIFRVNFGIGADDMPHGNNGQIWLKLRGPKANVEAAKLFVKGVVNQEEQQEVSYPGVLHCVFCGAKGLFMDSLIRNTSAQIVVGSPGFLLISGLTEPVVRAYSLIGDLVARYEGTQSRRSETPDRGLGESLDSRRAFKTLVEKWEDRHILDLLVLPGLVKEILLDLVKEADLGSSPSQALAHGNTGGKPHDSEDGWDKPGATRQTLGAASSTTDRWPEGMADQMRKDSPSTDLLFQAFSASTRGRAEGAEEKMDEGAQLDQQGTLDLSVKEGQRQDEDQEQHLSMGNKEFWLLLKFFTAMGYTEDVVKRVLARTGPKEASQILDLVQQEQDCSDRQQRSHGAPDPKNQEVTPLNRDDNRPCETEHKEYEGIAAGGDLALRSNGEVQEEEGGKVGSTKPFQDEGNVEVKEADQEDFVLGVLKKAAASCGYTEQNVAKVYSMLPEGSTRQLLLELQREGCRDVAGFMEGPRETDDAVLNNNEPNVDPSQANGREVELFFTEKDREPDMKAQVKVPNSSPPVAEPYLLTWNNNPRQPPVSEYTSQPRYNEPLMPQAILPEVKGPPMATYPPSLDPPHNGFQSDAQHGRTPYRPSSKQNHQTHNDTSNTKAHYSNSLKQFFKASKAAVEDAPSTRAREGRPFTSSVVVTGEQRFMEGLQTPFELKLPDKPGDPKLRVIIIDGSNVAMSHGLGHFFSCRGIALAVQHFWDRGHRHISAMLPQWRQKSDPKIKEQHYLTELQKLGLLSYTPSREFQGKKICSHDDRLILQVAQKTDGIIVTNNNLRDLLDVSPAWRDIIKKRLLQYTFVGDLFMVPDDPLGRSGPHLNDFLRSEHRTPDPGNHSFAGVATAFPSSKPPRSQTEVLNYRDRTLRGALDAPGEGSRAKGRPYGKRFAVGNQHGPAGPGLIAGGFPQNDRTPEETTALREQLSQVFPDQDNMVTLVLQCHPGEKDINALSGLILERQ